MKTLLITLLTLASTSSFAMDRTYTISTPDLEDKYRRTEIRHGSYFGDATFTPFFMELQVKLARDGVEVSPSKDTYYTDAILNYNYVMNRDDFYKLIRRAKMSASLTFVKDRVPYKTVEFSVNCNYLVQDGGNSTLKMNCVNRLKNAIVKTLKENLK